MYVYESMSGWVVDEDQRDALLSWAFDFARGVAATGRYCRGRQDELVRR